MIDIDDLTLLDVMKLDMLQRLQDAVSDAFLMPAIILDTEGRPITKPSRFSEFCTLLRATKKGTARCAAFQRKLMHAPQENFKPKILHDYVLKHMATGIVPIVIQNRHLANWRIGQMVEGELDADEVRRFAREVGLDENVLILATETISPLDEDSLNRVLTFLETRSEQIGRLAIQNLQQDRDIAARRRAEKEKASLEKQLHLAQKMESIGRLAGGVAHDFNNVLCAITGHATLALDGLPSGDPLRGSLEEISKAADRATDLTRQLLAFSRKQVIKPMVINLSNLIESLHPMLLRLIGEDILLKTIPKKEIGCVRADPNQVEQIVLNLAVNARDAMPNGGELLIETCDALLDDDYCARHANTVPGAFVMIAVSDTGCGMSTEIIEKIFEPFFTTKHLGQGTGLGLATVYGIVEQNGGRIEVYSEPDKGSSFKIYFPRVLDKAETLTPPTVTKPVYGEETVLLVEDEEMVRQLALKLLERLGYQVLAAAAPDEAISLLTQHEGPIDLLLTDVVMPRMNGRELAKKILKLRPNIKVLFTSGYTQNVIAHHGVLDENIEFLAKPYSLSTLATRVREVLDGAET